MAWQENTSHEAIALPRAYSLEPPKTNKFDGEAVMVWSIRLIPIRGAWLTMLLAISTTSTVLNDA